MVASDSLQEPGTPASPCFPVNTLWAWQSWGQVCGALVSALPKEALMIPSVSKIKGVERGLWEGAGWPHPPSPPRSSTRRKSHWCHGCHRFSHQEIHPCPHSSLLGECGWGTCQEPKVGGCDTRGQSGPVSSSLTGGSGGLLMCLPASVLDV